MQVLRLCVCALIALAFAVPADAAPILFRGDINFTVAEAYVQEFPFIERRPIRNYPVGATYVGFYEYEAASDAPDGFWFGIHVRVPMPMPNPFWPDDNIEWFPHSPQPAYMTVEDGQVSDFEWSFQAGPATITFRETDFFLSIETDRYDGCDCRYSATGAVTMSDPQPVPEPAGAWSIIGGLVVLLWRVRR